LRADYEATGSTPVISNEYWIVPQVRHQYDCLGRKVPAYYRCEVFHEDNYRATLDVSCRSYNNLLEQSNNKNREIREAV
jgi:tRNA U34 5-methylaminomethyl-2-thiouridine-forming methyltransferase MnmC